MDIYLKHNDMKNPTALICIMIISVFIIMSSCKKDNENTNPIPEKKKKYAWVTGTLDSTGYGMILFTPDGGKTWERQGLGTSALQGINVIDIWALNENNVWATGSDNVILRTTNGGQTWSQVQTPVNSSNPELTSISIVDNTNIWISGSFGTVYNSTDDGNTWTMFDTTFFQSAGLQGIWAIDAEKVYVVGNRDSATKGFIAYTLDGGTTWDTITPANDYNKWNWIGAVSYGNTIIIYGQRSHYMVSSDDGKTWINDSIPAFKNSNGGDINDLIMLDSQTWWSALDFGKIAFTTDGGENWIKQPTDGTAGGSFLVGIDTWDGQTTLSVGTASNWPQFGPIIKTINGGDSWERIYTCNSPLWKVTFIKD